MLEDRKDRGRAYRQHPSPKGSWLTGLGAKRSKPLFTHEWSHAAAPYHHVFLELMGSTIPFSSSKIMQLVAVVIAA